MPADKIVIQRQLKTKAWERTDRHTVAEGPPKVLRSVFSIRQGFHPISRLAYNCGPGVVNKSTVLKKLKAGNRDIFKSYTAHCRYNGKFHKQLHQRRLTEFAVFRSQMRVVRDMDFFIFRLVKLYA